MPEAKAHFEGLAQRWLGIAADLEATTALLATWGEVEDSEKPEV
jgi:hypothetical protein